MLVQKFFLISTAWLCGAAALLNAQQAGVYETFTHQANAESWSIYDYADGKWYYPNHDPASEVLNPDIYFTFAGANSLDFSADALSSGGAFVGDLVAAGVEAIACDYYVEDADSFSFAEFFFFSAADDRYYYSESFIPEADGWDVAYATLRIGDPWYVFEDGAYSEVELSEAILRDVTEIGMSFHPRNVAAANGKLVALDNFTTYGHYVLPQVVTQAQEGQFQLSFERRPGIGYSILSSSDLSTWTEVEGEQGITGNSPYSYSKALSQGSQFFKVEIEDVLAPVPELSP